MTRKPTLSHESNKADEVASLAQHWARFQTLITDAMQNSRTAWLRCSVKVEDGHIELVQIVDDCTEKITRRL